MEPHRIGTLRWRICDRNYLGLPRVSYFLSLPRIFISFADGFRKVFRRFSDLWSYWLFLCRPTGGSGV